MAFENDTFISENEVADNGNYETPEYRAAHTTMCNGHTPCSNGKPNTPKINHNSADDTTKLWLRRTKKYSVVIRANPCVDVNKRCAARECAKRLWRSFYLMIMITSHWTRFFHFCIIFIYATIHWFLLQIIIGSIATTTTFFCNNVCPQYYLLIFWGIISDIVSHIYVQYEEGWIIMNLMSTAVYYLV